MRLIYKLIPLFEDRYARGGTWLVRKICTRGSLLRGLMSCERHIPIRLAGHIRGLELLYLIC
jgi:hypothetical protein